MRHVGIAGIGTYLPQRWDSAADIGERLGLPADAVERKYGIRGKHVAAPDEHVSGMSAEAGRHALKNAGLDATDVDAVVYFGSPYKDYPVWQAAPKITHELGCTDAFALELDYVSCGGPIALRVCRDLLVAEPELRTVLAVAASRESHLVDYRNPKARFMYAYGDGAVGVVLTAGDTTPEVEVLGSAMVTDGSFADDVKVPAGGSVEPASHESVDASRHSIEVADPAGMSARLFVTMRKFLSVAERAAERSGIASSGIDFVCSFHMKRPAHDAMLNALGVPPERSEHLDGTGHMCGVDTLLGLDRAARAGKLEPGDHVLLIASGTGCTWAATIVRWGHRAG
jgi:3-oxoacyl-[acyl-carrier-protein] synthase-3